ncbi:UNVERIFIED_CONTAM: Zinc finger CCCH domain-containing protein 48 [Sesamum latifolium]|uniref:Zinc finger CCCH domain-containing protein 48 n=1 Tax=Sesamum latifolium TaxID=2727402 RepID=A0AAW2Y0K9_9LAMI
MHRESPPPQSHEIQSAPPKDIRGMQSKKMTWRRPNYQNPKTGNVSSNEGGMYSSTCGQSSRQKVLANTGKENGHIDQEMTIASSDIHSDIQAQPKQCKYWVTGNCVHGDKCKDLHSWFSGSGFTLLRKLEGHTKVSLIHKYFCTIFLRLLLGFPSHLALTSYIHVARINLFELGQPHWSGCLTSEGPWLLVGLQTALKAWKLQTEAEFSFGLLPGLVCSMVLDDDKLFAGMEDGSLLMWKLNLETVTLEAVEKRKEHNGAICSLVLGSNNRLYSGSRDGTIRVWDRQNLQCLHTLYGHTRDVMAVICWDNYLLSASLDNTLKIWAATESGSIEVIHEIKEDCGFIALCGIHDAEDKPILLCSCNDNTVRLYDLPSFTERGRIYSKREVEVIEIGGTDYFSPEMQVGRSPSGNCLEIRVNPNLVI